MKDYLLADDLSGALEAGAAFRARGWRVTLSLDPDAGTGAGAAGLDSGLGWATAAAASTSRRGTGSIRLGSIGFSGATRAARRSGAGSTAAFSLLPLPPASRFQPK